MKTEEIINSDGSRNWQANILLDNVKCLEKENKSLYEEKNCLHKIIDRLLENAGYSKDIASAEDFEDVYEDMQIKRNELIELEQENKELKTCIEMIKNTEGQAHIEGVRLSKENERYRSALEEIRILATKNVNIENFVKIQNKINEVLNVQY